LVNKSLSNEIFTKDPRTDKVKELWNEVNNYTYSKEQALIDDLSKNNSEKFEAINTILNNELNKNKLLKKDLKDVFNKENKLFIKVSKKEENKDFVIYKKTLDKYNEKFLLSAKALIE
jgi:hypothetical protein